MSLTNNKSVNNHLTHYLLFQSRNIKVCGLWLLEKYGYKFH